MTDVLIEAAKIRIAQIDAMFEGATSWGSWMVECANEREAYVAKLRAAGVDIEHKHLARSVGGRRVS